MPPRHQVKHDDARGPNIGLLGVGEDIRHLLRWLVEEGATLGEVCDRVEGILDGQPKVKQFNLRQIFVTPQDDIVRLDIAMNHVLLIVEIG